MFRIQTEGNGVNRGSDYALLLRYLRLLLFKSRQRLASDLAERVFPGQPTVCELQDVDPALASIAPVGQPHVVGPLGESAIANDNHRAGVLAEHPIVAQHEGERTLMIRVANARHNTISGATARLWLIRGEQSAEGQYFRRYYQLDLRRNENPVFALSWTIFHAIDESSPLYGASPDDLAQADALLVLTISGFDDNSAQQLNARRSYPQDHIRWQHRYVDISSNADDGRLVLDYGKFHDVRPEEDHDAGAAPSGA